MSHHAGPLIASGDHGPVPNLSQDSLLITAFGIGQTREMEVEGWMQASKLHPALFRSLVSDV
jgi:hypothetical protein